MMKYAIALLFLFFSLTAATSFILYNRLKHERREIQTLAIDPAILQRKLEGAPPKWMVERIAKDLGPFSSGIPRDLIERSFSGKQIETFSLVRFTIRGGHIAFAHDEKNLYSRHFRELLACFKKIAEYVEIPDADFIVSLEDGFAENPKISPCFVFAKSEEAGGLILIPDIKALSGYGKLRVLIPGANEQNSWERKEAKTFWRGSTTGGYSTLANWDSLARTKLVLLSLEHPEEIDARFNSVIQCDPEIPPMMRETGMVGKSVDRPDHLKYKYLIDVDGNSCSYERYFWLLLSNSLVIKQVTPNVQWYYGGLEPYKHYLPVKEDLSDLLEKIGWAREHDEECHLMAARASEFIRDNLSAEDTLLYLYLLLKEYSRLQKGAGVLSIEEGARG